jgi:hypothetical protein
MKATPFVLRPNLRSNPSSILCFAVAGVCLILAASCGGGNMSQNPIGTPIPAANTNVTLLLSSTANDQLSEFFMSIGTITLTSQDGTLVTLYTNPNLSNIQYFDEAVHLNASSEPIVTSSVPPGVYTSAAFTFVNPSFMLLLGPTPTSSFTLALYADSIGTENGTIDLPSPITITGTSMVLNMDLQLSQSYTFSNTQPFATYTITPVFNVAPVTIASNPTNEKNGKLSGLDGRITSLSTSGNGFAMLTTNRSSITVNSNSSTQFQGISDSSDLAVGTFVDMDGNLQADGSLIATRIAVEDTTALNVMTGPLLQFGPSPINTPSILVLGRQQQGDDLSVNPTEFERYQYGDTTLFQASGQFSNISSLPFVATFNGANLAMGQNVYVSSPSISFQAVPITPTTTVTLMPQTINGTIGSVTTSGSFEVYTVDLAPYDFIPTLNGATSVVVYVDNNTQLLNSAPFGLGSVMRFNGLIFNDGGILRMDCRQVNDGVAE